MAACRLCGSDSKLIKSHIFPEFLYQLAYDPTHRLEGYKLARDVPPRFIQKGLREKLLCVPCDQRIGRWEQYASQILFHSEPKAWKRVGSQVVLEGVDYSKFKLFTLSLIWRSSISSLQEFHDIRLGRHEELIRSQLLSESPGPHYEYPCFLRVFVEEKALAEGTILPPYSSRVAGHVAYKALFSRILWTWVISSHTGPLTASSGILKADGQLPVLLSKPGAERAFFQRIAQRLPPKFFKN